MRSVLTTCFLLTVIALLLASCGQSPVSVQQKPLAKPNPTSYSFNIPETQLRDTVIKMFAVAPQMSNKILASVFMEIASTPDVHFIISFTPETASNAVFGKDHFAQPDTRNDVFITSMGAYWYSPVYVHGKKPFEYHADYAIHFKPLGINKTLLSIKAIKPEIVNGSKCCGPSLGTYALTQKAEPSTIEEYTLIRYIADRLGVNGLPPTQLP